MPQIDEERLASALVSQGVELAEAQAIASEAAFAASTVIEPAATPGPSSPEQDFTQQVSDAYAGRNAYYGGGPGALGGAGGAGGPDSDTGETEAERIARLEREAEDARRANELDFARQQAEQQTAQRRQDARSTMAAVLDTYGLGELSDFVYNEIIAKETVNINNPDAIIFAIREQPAYQKRFAGNAARLKKGLSELDPASYIGLENQFRQTLQSNGLPANFYDQTEDFQALIEGDVSPSELNERVQQGYRAVADADPAVKEQMKNLYGVDEGQLAAYFLDPKRTAPLLTRQAQAANIAARGLEQGGIQLTGAFAENLAARGISEQQARAGFAEVGALGELRQTFAGETALSSEQLAGAAFGIDVAAQQELERKRRLRTGEFAGGGSFARTTGETSGSISTSVGKAQ
jgi:hypothetical protein